MTPLTLERATLFLAHAREQRDRALAARAAGTRLDSGEPLYLAEPACDRACARCELTCAVLHAGVATYERAVRRLGGNPDADVLSHDGVIYMMEAGHA